MKLTRNLDEHVFHCSLEDTQELVISISKEMIYRLVLGRHDNTDSITLGEKKTKAKNSCLATANRLERVESRATGWNRRDKVQL
jgi:hypothetical protein